MLRVMKDRQLGLLVDRQLESNEHSSQWLCNNRVS